MFIKVYKNYFPEFSGRAAKMMMRVYTTLILAQNVKVPRAVKTILKKRLYVLIAHALPTLVKARIYLQDGQRRLSVGVLQGNV